MPVARAGVPRLQFIPPQMPTLSAKPPEGDDWIHEVKHDGYRAQLIVAGGRTTILTRTGLDWTDRFPAIASAAGKLVCASAIIDGEVVVQDPDGRANFHDLRRVAGTASKKPVLIAFDLLHLNGKDLTKAPLAARRAELAELLAREIPAIGFSEAFTGAGSALFDAVEKMELEGIVSKLETGTYRGGASKSWLKTKCWMESELTLIGVERDRTGIPIAILAREDEKGRLHYAGGAMITLSQDAGRWQIKGAAEAARSPIAGLRRPKATWLKPDLRLRVKHLRGGGELRHATVAAVIE